MNLASLHYRKYTAQQKVETLFHIYLTLASRILPSVREDIFILLGFGHLATPSPQSITALHSKTYLYLFNISCWILMATLTVGCSCLEKRSRLSAGSLPAGVYPCNWKFRANTCDITEILTQTDKSNFCSALQEVLRTIWAFRGWEVGI